VHNQRGMKPGRYQMNQVQKKYHYHLTTYQYSPWLSRGRFQTDGRMDDRMMAAGASVTWTHCSILFKVTWDKIRRVRTDALASVRIRARPRGRISLPSPLPPLPSPSPPLFLPSLPSPPLPPLPPSPLLSARTRK
jgi:hypothetical protein